MTNDINISSSVLDVFNNNPGLGLTFGDASRVVWKNAGCIVLTRISILALARPQYTPAPLRTARPFTLNPAHHLCW